MEEKWRIMTHNMGRARVILDLQNRGGLGRNEEDKKCLVEGGVWVNQPRSHYLSFFPSPEAGRRESMGTRLRVKWAYIQQG